MSLRARIKEVERILADSTGKQGRLWGGRSLKK